MSTAADDLIRAHADMVFATCLRITGNAQDAADVSQEVFIAWMRQRGSIRGPVAAWLHGAARRRSLDWLRRHHRRGHHERRVESAQTAEPPGEDHDWRVALDGCLAALNPRERTLVIEHHVMGLSQEALGVRWHLSQATISRHLTRALERLRRGLASHGVTAATVGGLPALLRAEGPCPSGLVDPVLAQARIAGPDGFLGGGRLPAWWSGWPLWVGGAAAGLALAATAILLVWRSQVATSVAPGAQTLFGSRLPPAGVTDLHPSPGVPRYWSIERLIAMLQPRDADLQEQILAWMTRDGSEAAWQRLAVQNEIATADIADARAGFPTPTQGTLQETDRRMLAEAGPLLDMLGSAHAMLGEGAWLETAYRGGRIRWWGDIITRTGMASRELSTCRYLMHALARQAIGSAHPEADLSRIDALVAAHHRGTGSLLSAMFGLHFAALRDDVYLRLALHGRLPPDRLAAWCRETPSANRLVERGVIGDPLLIAIPQDEDLTRWGSAAGSQVDPPATTAAPDLLDWLERPWRQRMSMQSIEALLRIGDALGGRDRLDRIEQAYADASPLTRLAMPYLAESAQTAAKARLAHSGKRMMAWLVHASSHGEMLPDTLDGVVDVLADGRALLGGSDLTYGLAYRKLSATRFRLEIDAHGVSPVYADPGRLTALALSAAKPARGSPSDQPIVIRDVAWEADVQRLQEPAAANLVIPAEPEPISPSASN